VVIHSLNVTIAINNGCEFSKNSFLIITASTITKIFILQVCLALIWYQAVSNPIFNKVDYMQEGLKQAG
jgi:hypothetical protein